MQLTQKQKTIPEFFSAFLKSKLDLEHIKKKNMTLIGNVFRKLRPSKNAFR